jgi:gamma-glutamyl:cysteine ligase YbdK (ATP-grasp superfamily)
MAAVSLSLSLGQDGLRANDYTVGTLAPNVGDVEVRVNTTVSKKAALVALEACINALVARNDVTTALS